MIPEEFMTLYFTVCFTALAVVLVKLGLQLYMMFFDDGVYSEPQYDMIGSFNRGLLDGASNRKS